MSGARKLLIYDDNAPLYKDLLCEALETKWRVEVGPNSTAWLRERIPDADAAIGLRFPPELLHSAAKLKLLLFPGAGFLHRDPMELPEGCQHANVYEHEIPISEYVFLALLTLVTGQMESRAAFGRGEWLGNGRIGGEPRCELFGGTLGLIGFGHIGREVARRALAFGLTVQAIRSRPVRAGQNNDGVHILGGPESLSRLLATSDFVVVACPLTPETHGLLTAAQLRLLRPHAVLVNVARAEIVDEAALFEALRDRWFRAAALDVWYLYPSRPDERLHGSRFPFHELPNVLATPHSSAWTAPMIARRARQMAANLDRFARGESLERVVLTGAWRSSCGSAA
jgi:phosphoglycerate dehydrogenase-like enzyme